MIRKISLLQVFAVLLVLCLPCSAADKPFIAWTAAAGAAAAADAFTTVSCLNRGSCQEGNPVLGSSPGTGKIVALKTTSFAVTTAASAYLRHKGHRLWWVPQLVQVGTSGVFAGLNLRF